jgi:protein-S-isoprenylcysteine O-methyltransferase Ste14
MSPRVLSIVAFVVLVLAIAYLFTIDQLFGRGPVTIALQVAAVLLMIWARVTFGRRSFHAAANPTAGGLVTWGPYRYVRHPIYASIWLFFWAGIADHLSWLTAVIGLIVPVALFVRMINEEKLIIRQNPEYAEYARRTKRVLPGVF